MIVENEEKLKEWIINDISPLCDAEPDALAKYVVALLKKDIDMSALKNFCIDQLDVFLQNQTVDFVNRLFQKLTDKSYIETKNLDVNLNVSKNLSVTAAPAISENILDSTAESKTDLESSTSTKKSARSGSESETSKAGSQDSRKSFGTAKERFDSKEKPDSTAGKSQRRRISPPAVTSTKEEPKIRGHSPRERKRIEPPSPIRPARAGGRHERERRKSRSRSRSPYDRFERERRKEDRENRDLEKRFRCRDFDERGYCMRGDKCPYDHGPDPVVVEDSALEKMVQMKSGAPGFNMAVSTYSPLNPPPPGVDNIYSASSMSNINEGYNPEAPGLTAPSSVANIDFSVPPPPLPQRLSYAATATIPGAVTVAPNMPPLNAYEPIHQVPGANLKPHFGGPRGLYPRRRGGGRFGGVHRPPATNKSLQVKKIPLELNNIASLNEHFGKFGHVTNIQLQFDGSPDSALVTFSTRNEAQAAFSSTEPIFNNRFIKVFWHNPSPPATTTTGAVTTAGAVTTSGSVTTKPVVKHDPPAGTVPVVTKHRGAMSKAYVDPSKLESGAIPGEEPVNPIGLLTRSDGSPMNPVAVARVNRNKRIDREKKLRLVDVHRRKTELYKKQVEQQKLLLEKIQKAENSETKKKLFTLFKSLDTSSVNLKKELEDLWVEIQALAKASESAPSNGAAAKKRKRTDTDELEDNEVPRKIQQNRKSDTIEYEPYMRVLHVLGCDPQFQDDLIVHMEKFGDLFDMEFLPQAKGRKAIFHYKNIEDAKKAYTEASKFTKCPITLEWAPNSIVDAIIVPDEHRKPNEQVTPAALLASLGDDDEPDLSSESNASSETSELASSYIASKEKEHEELQNHKIGIVLEDLKTDHSDHEQENADLEHVEPSEEPEKKQSNQYQPDDEGKAGNKTKSDLSLDYLE